MYGIVNRRQSLSSLFERVFNYMTATALWTREIRNEYECQTFKSFWMHRRIIEFVHPFFYCMLFFLQSLVIHLVVYIFSICFNKLRNNPTPIKNAIMHLQQINWLTGWYRCYCMFSFSCPSCFCCAPRLPAISLNQASSWIMMFFLDSLYTIAITFLPLYTCNL